MKRTTDMGFVCALRTIGFLEKDIEVDHKGEATFIFEDEKAFDQHWVDFFNNKTKVNPFRLLAEIKDMKVRIKTILLNREKNPSKEENEEVEELRRKVNKVNIVEGIEAFVELKKAGGLYKGCCPFHEEKTPSFTVSKEKKMWYCFGCQKGGDLFMFLRLKLGFESDIEFVRRWKEKGMKGFYWEGKGEPIGDIKFINIE